MPMNENIAAGPIEGPGRCEIEIRWNAQARAFFVEYGNARFSVTSQVLQWEMGTFARLSPREHVGLLSSSL